MTYPFPRAWSEEEPDDDEATLARGFDEGTAGVFHSSQAQALLDDDDQWPTASAPGFAAPVLALPWPPAWWY